MNVVFKGICTQFVGKTSQTGNLYYQVDLTETIETGNPDEPKKDICYKNLYLNIGKPIENHKEFIGRSVEAAIVVFPVEKKVGDRVFQEIKLRLDDIIIL